MSYLNAPTPLPPIALGPLPIGLRCKLPAPRDASAGLSPKSPPLSRNTTPPRRAMSCCVINGCRPVTSAVGKAGAKWAKWRATGKSDLAEGRRRGSTPSP